MSDLVILRDTSRADEVNNSGVSYKVNKFGCVRVPKLAVAPLLKSGGFHRAKPTDPARSMPNSPTWLRSAGT